MAQPFPPAQYPPPPQNGIPAEYATPHAHAHPHPPADYTGPSTVNEHALTLYTPTHSQSEQPGNDSNTPNLTANTVTELMRSALCVSLQQAEEAAQTRFPSFTCNPASRRRSSSPRGYTSPTSLSVSEILTSGKCSG
ncbi:RNA binding protein fox-1 like 1 [Dissostichus eleginoides]|uniref:RNA binding protein fox-1 like 1 n=1 Tax=Dissostichus eleginoides TaxID=100907 RepID=A0AAD9EY71_DISEL|nr:RNA binding protein fox-1 like 1 [Dissostichus eleginoides]